MGGAVSVWVDEPRTSASGDIVTLDLDFEVEARAGVSWFFGEGVRLFHECDATDLSDYDDGLGVARSRARTSSTSSRRPCRTLRTARARNWCRRTLRTACWIRRASTSRSRASPSPSPRPQGRSRRSQRTPRGNPPRKDERKPGGSGTQEARPNAQRWQCLPGSAIPSHARVSARTLASGSPFKVLNTGPQV